MRVDVKPISWALTLCLAAAAALTLGLPRSAAAQEVVCDSLADFPCSLQVEEVALQKVPARLKFQARVSQAKLPIGEGLFETLTVNLLSGGTILCSEAFTSVQVKGSVLNLDIGANMSCDLAETIAENNALSFQICPGSGGGCLEAIELGTVPYAVKSSYAALAQSAHKANEAGHAHYAHRASADRDLFVRKTLGTGYFDFYTHAASDASAIYDAETYAAYENGGFIQWTPTRDREARTLHVSAKDQDTDALVDLEALILRAEQTEMSGTLQVASDASVGGAAAVDGALTVGGDATVTTGKLTVGGDGAISGYVTVGQDLTLPSGALSVGAGATIGAGLTTGSDVGVGGDLTVSGDASVAGAMDVTGVTTFEDLVIFNGGTMDPDAQAQLDELYMLRTGETRDIAFGGTMTFDGPAVFEESVQMDLNLGVDGDLKVGGGLMNTDIDADLVLADDVVVNGTLKIYQVESTTTWVDINDDLHVLGDVMVDDAIVWPENPDGGGGDTASIQYYAESDDGSEDTVLELKVTDGAEDTIWLNASGGVDLWGGLRVEGDSTHNADLHVTGDAGVGGALQVTGDAGISANLYVTGEAGVTSDLHVLGSAGVVGNLTVEGFTIMGGWLYAANIDAPNEGEWIDFHESAHLYQGLLVEGGATFNGDVTGLTATLTGCDTGSTACQAEGIGRGIEYLDRLGVYCGAGKVMTSVYYENCAGGVLMTRTCCSITVQ
jgi:cytoskeletal protein CcmA (bactofilin family)